MNNFSLVYFQLLGVYNLTVKPNASRECCLICWTWIHIILLITLSCGICFYARQIFFIVDTLGTSADIIQVAAPFLTHYIILMESILTRHIRRKVVHRLNEADKLFPLPLVLITKQSHAQRYFRKLLIAQALSLFFEICIMNGISAIELWSRHWYASIFGFIVCRSQHLFYVYHVDLVHSRLQLISNELQSVSLLNKTIERTNIGYVDDVGVVVDDNKEMFLSTYCLYNRIKRAKIAYNRIWEMVQFIEMAFGWSMFANITSNFICLTVNLYWNYASLLYIQSNTYWKESLMCSFPMIITLYVLFSSCKRCLQTVSGQKDII